MDYEDDPRRPRRGNSRRGSSRSGNGRSSSRGGGGHDRDRYDDGTDPRASRKKNGASRTSASSSSTSSPPRRKKKKKPGASAAGADDLLEAKMQAKKKKERGGSSKADDALEAKIRKKNAAASSNNASVSRRARNAEWEEEKVEEGLSVYSDDEENGQAYDSNPRSGVSSGVPVAGGTDEGGNPLFTRGGGDVRNRPPPQAGAAGSQLDPLREAELEKQKNKKQVNSRFADLHETGQWGGLSKWEKYGICLLTSGAIAAAVVLGLKFGNPKGDDTPQPTSRPTKAPSVSPTTSPSMAPTDVDYREETGLQLMIQASPKLTLPQTVEDLKSKSRSEMTPQEIAANYVLFLDPLEIPARDPRFLERYALVVFYYANGGCAGDWINKFNWLNGEDHCDGEWYGIVCDLKKRVIEVNLSKNYVTGEVPMEFGQMLELSTLDLSNNALMGAVPSEAISTPKLYTIQLNNNRLDGEFPFEAVKNGATILDNLWIQENTELTGTITNAYCGMNSITLDCDSFDPQPTYPIEDPDDTGFTNFQITCLSELGPAGLPKEYTCNFDDPVPFVRPDDLESEGSAPESCGVGNVFK